MSVAPVSCLAPIAPGAMLGVLGGGQLGRMFVHAAQAQGFRVAVLDPDANSPAAAAADLHLQANYQDPLALARLQQLCAAVTTEFENVPADALQQLVDAGIVVSPSPSAVRVCQHRALEKQCFLHAAVPCAPHALISGPQDLEAVLDLEPALLPGILKTAALGYDGKGQAQVASSQELRAAWRSLGEVPAVLERRLPLKHELSVIVARGADGACVHLPVQQNLHRDGVLAVTQVPGPGPVEYAAIRAVEQAQALARALGYVGVLCVEFFVLEDGSLVANEMAPRPHNSGHYSIDACDVSQFDLQLRTLVSWPLPVPRQHSAAVMLNLLGDLWFSPNATDPQPRSPPWSDVLVLPGVHLHLYGKSQARLGRKMGHLTVTAADGPSARRTALQAATLLGLPGF